MSARITELVFRGDNRSAVRSLMGIAEQSDKTTRKLKTDARESDRAFKGAADSTKRLHGALTGLAGTVGLGGLAIGFKDVISAGEQWQAQQAQLRNALKNTGAYSTETMKGLMDSAERLSTHGGFGASDTLKGLTQFVRQSGNAADAVNKVTLATNIARGSGRDFNQILRALMMAEQGRTTGLARLGVAVPKITSAEDALKNARVKHADALKSLEAAGYKFTAAQKAEYALHTQITPAMLAHAKAQDKLSTQQKVFALLQHNYAHATDTFSKSSAGQISNMRNAWETLQKSIGQGLLPVVNKLLNVAAKLFGWLNKNRIVLYGVLAATAAVSAVLVGHAAIMAVVNAKTYALRGAQRLLGVSAGEAAAGEEGAAASTTLFGAAMDALPIIAIVAGLVVLATHFDMVKKIAGIAWNWIKTAAANTWNWIKGHWPLLLGILLAPFTGGLSLVPGLFHKHIIGAVNTVWNFIKSAGRGILTALEWPFKEAAKAIKWLFDHTPLGIYPHLLSGGLKIGSDLLHGNVGGAAKDALSTGKSVLHSASFGLLHGGGPVARHFAYGGPVGTDTIPGWLSDGEYVLNRGMVAQAGMGNLEAWRLGGQGGMGGIEVQVHPQAINLDGRTIGEVLAHATVKRAARGASSLVGGAMITGARQAV